MPAGGGSIFGIRGYRARWERQSKEREEARSSTAGRSTGAETVSSRSLATTEEGLGREEFEQYWRERGLVSPGGRISVDLLAFVAEDQADRLRLLRDCGMTAAEAEVAEVFLQVLQLDAEHRVRRLQRQRIAKRGPEASLAMALAAKVARREVPRDLEPGEAETVAWLEGRSGAVHQPRRKDMGLYGLEEEGATQRDLEKARLKKEHQAFVKEMQLHPELKLVREAKKSRDPMEYLTAAAGALRASTLRKRLREWMRFRRWLEGIYKVQWPVEPFHAVDYLIGLRNTGAPRTVPQSFAAALGFFERAAGATGEERLSEEAGCW